MSTPNCNLSTEEQNLIKENIQIFSFHQFLKEISNNDPIDINDYLLPLEGSIDVENPACVENPTGVETPVDVEKPAGNFQVKK